MSNRIGSDGAIRIGNFDFISKFYKISSCTWIHNQRGC